MFDGIGSDIQGHWVRFTDDNIEIQLKCGKNATQMQF